MDGEQGGGAIEQHLTIVDIAAALKMDRRSLRRWIIRGIFPPADISVGANFHRWREETVKNWIAARAKGDGTTR